MESVNNILEDNNIPEIEKLQRVNILLDTKLERHEDNINIDIIYNINTENIELKCDVLKKVLISANNFEDNIEYFIKYFKKTFTNLENHKLLAKCLEFILEIKTDKDQMQNILNQLGVENVNKVLLRNIFLQKSNKEFTIFKTYLKHLRIDHQVMFFNNVFELSEIYQDVEIIYLTLKNIDQDALTHDKSILRTQDLWIYLSNYLENCKKHQESETIILILQSCLKLVKSASLELQFLSVEDDINAWDAFFAVVEICINGNRELIQPVLQLLGHVSSLHYIWQRSVCELMVKHTPLKCADVLFILKNTAKNENLNISFRLIFSVINERNCNNKECPVFTELKNFCENINVQNFALILDELLNIFWKYEPLWKVLGNVLVDSKKQLVDFGYCSRILKHLEKYNFGCFPALELNQILAFFYDPENFEFWRQIRESGIPFSTYQLSVPDKLENTAISKLIELSNTNSNDLAEIETYLRFLKGLDKYIDVIKDYPISIHVRIVIYRQLFTTNGYNIAQTKLNKEKTVNDFHEYLLNHLSEKTYINYKKLMLSFLELMGKLMGFTYPEKACSEFLKIILNPELYTKYQICCTTEILRWTYYRFSDLNFGNKEFYKKIGQNWRHFIMETEDTEICKQGLYFVLEKGQLNSKECHEIVEKLLEKHLCDDVTEEIYSRYLDVDLMKVAFRGLRNIKETSFKNYEKFSKLFCEAVVSRKYIFSNQFSCENEEFQFCCLNSKNLEYAIREVDSTLFNYSDDLQFTGKMINVIIEIYLNKLSNLDTRVYCLHVILRIVVTHSYAQMPPNYYEYFKKDVKWIINRFKEKYAINLEDDIYKLRIIQALFLLIPYVMRDFDDKFKKRVKGSKVNVYKKFRNSLKRIAVGILVKESDSKNITARQICQYMYILLSEHDPTFEDMQRLIEKVKEQPKLACSFMPVLYHVMPFCKFTENEVEEIFTSMFSLLLISDDKLRIYAQVVLQHIYILCNNGKYTNIIEKYTPRLEKINSDIESNKNEITDVLKTDYVFLNVLDPIRDHSLETVLYIFPKLNRVRA